MPTRENKRFDKRIVSFPRMGNVHIPVCSVLGGMGAEIILPPANNKETLSLGTRYSPETMCLPYKMNLGNYIQAIEKGANTLLMFGAPGSCRLGTYAIQAEAKLKELGYDFEMVVFDLYKGGVVELIEKFSRATDSKNILGGIRGLKLGLSKFAALDEVEKGLLYWRPREKDAGNAERIYLKGVRLIDKAASHDEVRNAVSQTLDEYRGIPVNKNREILKIFLTGEFYVLLEPFANMGIEKMLGNLGVEVQRQIMLSEWVSQAITPKWLRTWKTRKEKSKKY
ncbi:MAG: CoA protein activase, partial [Candidatus Gastranaerophilales bacterium]|nr:CoA protein activase [Candidatus Gastranaerophilales bacterium]